MTTPKEHDLQRQIILLYFWLAMAVIVSGVTLYVMNKNHHDEIERINIEDLALESLYHDQQDQIDELQSQLVNAQLIIEELFERVVINE